MSENFGKPGEYWIAVDLDGTLAHYNGWKGADHIGDPVPRMMERVKHWIAEGKKVAIFTARACDPEKVIHVRMWLGKHGLAKLEITATKHPKFKEFWDDRAVQIIPNTGEVKG